MQFWDVHTGQSQFLLHGHKNSVISIAMSETGGLLATGSGDWQARIFKISGLDASAGIVASTVGGAIASGRNAGTPVPTQQASTPAPVPNGPTNAAE